MHMLLLRMNAADLCQTRVMQVHEDCTLAATHRCGSHKHLLIMAVR